jgi:hypothetical protein
MKMMLFGIRNFPAWPIMVQVNGGGERIHTELPGMKPFYVQ